MFHPAAKVRGRRHTPVCQLSLRACKLPSVSVQVGVQGPSSADGIRRWLVWRWTAFACVTAPCEPFFVLQLMAYEWTPISTFRFSVWLAELRCKISVVALLSQG